ncbi:MAG: hypothetical protein ACLR2O_10435 [Coprococcus sp.]
MIVKTENLSREFVRGKNQFYAVDHVNLEVEEKELVAIMGQSGSGKIHPLPYADRDPETDRRKDHSTGS